MSVHTRSKSLPVSAARSALFALFGLLAACGASSESPDSSTPGVNLRESVETGLAQSTMAAATHQICGNNINVRDSNFNVIGTATTGDRVSLTGEVRTGTGSLAGSSFRKVYFHTEPTGYGWVATQFICALSGTPTPTPPATGARVIEVNLGSNRLKYFVGGSLVREWNVGTARAGYVTPRGTFKIHTKDVCPPYFGDGSQNIPGCSGANPLGTRALWWDGFIYGLHGTSRPDLIAEGTTAEQRRVSSGCVRNANPNIEWLFGQVRVGDTIVVK